jgi:hypothetical protein
VFVRFDQQQTSAEAIVGAAKAGLESDPFNANPIGVTLTAAPVQAPAALEPIVRFLATDLWVRPLDAASLRLNTELFDCGTCGSQVSNTLQQTPGVLQARLEQSPGGTVVAVAYDPSAITAEQVADIAKQALEADPFLQTTVAVHFFTPD